MSRQRRVSPWDTEGCSKCGSKRAQFPGLQLKYSTCCGSIRCKECIDKMSSRVSDPCIGCSAALTRKDFSLENFDQQLFHREHTIRDQVNKTFTLERKDFETSEEYNDYLETQQDIVYDLLEGTKENQEAARRRLDEFRIQNEGRIQAAYQRQLAEAKRMEYEEKEAERKADPGLDKSTGEPETIAPAVQARVPVFIRPDILNEKGEGLTREEERAARTRIKALPQPQRDEELTQLNTRLERGRIAGGFRGIDDHMRSLQEALDGLLV